MEKFCMTTLILLYDVIIFRQYHCKHGVKKYFKLEDVKKYVTFTITTFYCQIAALSHCVSSMKSLKNNLR